MKKVLIASLNFSPGHYSHMVGLAYLCQELALSPTLLLHEGYRKFDSEFPNIKLIFFDGSIPMESFDFVFIQNPAVKNHIFVKDYKKKFSNAVIYYIFHEPFDGWINKTKEGMKGFLKAIIAYQFNKKTLKVVDYVLLPSQHAINLYKKCDSKFNEKYCYMPLLFDDETNNFINDSNLTNRPFFSYIGTVAKSHDFKGFLALIKYFRQIGSKIQFLIATKTNLNKVLKTYPWLGEMVAEKKLKIAHGKPLTNKEINEYFAQSFCVWNVYRRSTQSGVLPKSFMFGTPVLASPICSFPEYVKNGFNGELINSAKDYAEISFALRKIEESLPHYSLGARRTFLENFYFKANIQSVRPILEWKMDHE